MPGLIWLTPVTVGAIRADALAPIETRAQSTPALVIARATETIISEFFLASATMES